MPVDGDDPFTSVANFDEDYSSALADLLNATIRRALYSTDKAVEEVTKRAVTEIEEEEEEEEEEEGFEESVSSEAFLSFSGELFTIFNRDQEAIFVRLANSCCSFLRFPLCKL
ncbi:unnamed protein product [Microthlaspi erraticum]|uniref:Uncharacterized protein n=1 Tax=Microthlaspi erraticum TaxID=1685480 RepID=A0A6D2IJK3_9BRAS|nr:unnamed protein product [Microthlaspi erraticum]